MSNFKKVDPYVINKLFLKQRHMANMSQLAFHKKTGISRYTISNLETYRTFPRAEDMERLRLSLELTWQQFGALIDEIYEAQ